MPDVIFVYVACPDLKVARKIAGHCVEERIAACGNILPQMESFYWWDGHVNHENEVVLILKTTTDHFEELKSVVKQMHPYELPCIAALPIVDGLPDYLNWIKTETKSLN